MKLKIPASQRDDGNICSFLLLADDYGLRMYGVGSTYTIEPPDAPQIPNFLREAKTLFDFRVLPA
jgi:hypothetical protein